MLALIDAHGLQELADAKVNAEQGFRVVDVRTRNGRPQEGLAMYRDAHIPGALHLDLETQLSAATGPGRHPLPSVAEFVETLSAAGIGPSDTVVCYDDVAGAIASRLWWMLDNLGMDSVHLLDGGLQAWKAANLPLESKTPDYPRRPWPAEVRERCPQVDQEALLSGLDSFRVLDARAEERYRGEVEPLDPVAGHIPGAINAPFSENLEGGRFKSPEALRAHFAQLGIKSGDKVVHSCGSGVTACHNILAMRVAGFDRTALYPGSWSDWCRSGLPVERS